MRKDTRAKGVLVDNTTIKDYNNSTLKPDYTLRVIMRCLESYTQMQEGEMPAGEKLCIQSGNDVPACQVAVETKYDLDKAISSLTNKEKLVIVCFNIMGFTYQEIAFWLECSSLDVAAIDDIALRKMRKYLNG